MASRSTRLGQPPAVLSEAAIAAAAQEAHSRGKLVFAHPQTREGLLNAVHGGADVIVHTIPNAGVLDDSMLIPMKEAGARVIPTLKLWRHEMRDDRTSQREPACGVRCRAIANLGGFGWSGPVWHRCRVHGRLRHLRRVCLDGRGRNELSPNFGIAHNCAGRAIRGIRPPRPDCPGIHGRHRCPR